MRYFFTVFLLLNFIFLKGQHIPEFSSNTNEDDKKKSVVFNKYFHSKYTEIISYSSECYWPKEQWFFILALKESKWELFKLAVKYKDIWPKTFENIKRISKKKLHLNRPVIDSLFNYWSGNNFFNLNRDSLNCNEKQTSDSTFEMIGMSDGCSDRFDILANGNYKIVNVNEADYLQKYVAVKDRELFILCRNRFFELMNRK